MDAPIRTELPPAMRRLSRRLATRAKRMPEALASTVYRELLFPPPETGATPAHVPLTTF